MSNCYANVCGGVGNQLFQIATAYSYAVRFGKDLKIDACHWHASQGRSPLEYKDSIFKNFEYGIGKNAVTLQEKRFGYDPLPDIEGEVSLEGYFQSLKYFENCVDEFISRLNLPEVKTDYIKDKNVAFHIRRGDYLNYGDLFKIGKNYFPKQFENFKDYQINVFTDSPELVLREFHKYNFNLIQTSSELKDLTSISKHDNVVCSNSTFSWWASLLGKKKNKIIVPNEWIKGQDCSDIYRLDMTKMSCS